jgi:hypothetical protein
VLSAISVAPPLTGRKQGYSVHSVPPHLVENLRVESSGRIDIDRRIAVFIRFGFKAFLFYE